MNRDQHAGHARHDWFILSGDVIVNCVNTCCESRARHVVDGMTNGDRLRVTRSVTREQLRNYEDSQ